MFDIPENVIQPNQNCSLTNNYNQTEIVTWNNAIV